MKYHLIKAASDFFNWQESGIGTCWLLTAELGAMGYYFVNDSPFGVVVCGILATTQVIVYALAQAEE